MGKWTHLKGKFATADPLEGQEGKFAEKVKALMSTIDGLDLRGLGGFLAKAKAEKARLEDLLTNQNAAVKAAEILILKALDAQSLTSVRLEGVGLLYTEDQVQVKQVDRIAVKKWLHEEGLDDLLTVHAQTLSSTVKDLLEEGKAAPDGVDVKFYTALRQRKA